MLERFSTSRRVISVVAGAVISTACGTNYAYSAWAPQFCKKLLLSSTDSNLIGTSANFGMYLFGVPLGMLVDSRGPRTGALLGAVFLGAGYYGLYQAYIKGPGAIQMVFMCFFAALTGIGGASAFFGAIKTATMNWPTHRGTATAFPLAGFGLSAFLFSLVGGIAFHGDTSGLLLFFALGTCVTILVLAIFLEVVPIESEYAEVPTDVDVEDQPSDHFEPSLGREGIRAHERATFTLSSPGIAEASRDDSSRSRLLSCERSTGDESNSDDIDDKAAQKRREKQNSIYDDIRGVKMFRYSEFYELFLLLGSMTGIGLMTINNIGNDAQALWSTWDSYVTDPWIEKQQKTYVSTISILSAVGRLLSGIGGDFLVMRLQMSRFWCLMAASILFCLAQIIAILVENPNLLILLSACTGLAYGVLFGVFPSLTAETFGSNGISTNWGFMTLSPIIFGNIFNIFYGQIYDQHSQTGKEGHLECPLGRFCYKDAYWLTFVVSISVMFLILWSIRHRQRSQEKCTKRARISDATHFE